MTQAEQKKSTTPTSTTRPKGKQALYGFTVHTGTRAGSTHGDEDSIVSRLNEDFGCSPSGYSPLFTTP